MFPGGTGIAFAAEGADTHNTVNYRMLGDGSSTTSALADGIYLLSMQLASTQSGLNPSDPFHFVLNKNTPWSTVSTAVGSLGIGESLVQWVVPEPGTFGLMALAIIGICGAGALRRKWRGY